MGKKSEKVNKMFEHRQRIDIASIKKSYQERLLYSLGKDYFSATKLDLFKALAYLVRDRLVDGWLRTQRTYYEQDVKRVYYLSMEFLIGRTLGNSLVNLKLENPTEAALGEMNLRLDELEDTEWDAGLGNGGLGRLAACFLDSMATLGIPAYGYGIRYEYGIFFQHITDGYQKETPDNWLRYGNPWEMSRPEDICVVKFYGNLRQYKDARGRLSYDWLETQNVVAMAYDYLIPGYDTQTVNTMRLWAAKSAHEFNLSEFNVGDYVGAVEQKDTSEIISKVLYPNDQSKQGRELRFKQEYFFVSATLQDVLRRYKKHRSTFAEFAEKTAIQLNDTHPAIAIAELMRLLLDEEKLDWDTAWRITEQTFAYTNHTILPEALEKWSVDVIERVLPRHIQIIYEINLKFLDEVWRRFPGDHARRKRMSIIEEGSPRYVRMAHLAIVGSHSVNGVSALHSDLLKMRLFKDFFELWPEKFNNKTNGITQRRWLGSANRPLSQLITKKIGSNWLKDPYELRKLIPYAEDSQFQKEWMDVKRKNKERLAHYIEKRLRINVSLDSIFDVQIKRIHEYKRQLLNLFHVITLYNRIKDNPTDDYVPRTVIFGGKAAPGDYIAKLIIKLINSVANIVNGDPDIGDRLKVVFIPNYGVTLAEKIIPAADLSEQISTAGMEASGTGNMKFALNGGLTIGTLDGANIEIKDEVGDENIFIFGLTAELVEEMKQSDYDPRHYYQHNPDLKRVIDMINDGYFLPGEKNLFQPIISSIFDHKDPYMLLPDYAAYVACQDLVAKTFMHKERWAKMSILNVANIGKFSSDRTIQEYASEIWEAEPVIVPAEEPETEES